MPIKLSIRYNPCKGLSRSFRRRIRKKRERVKKSNTIDAEWIFNRLSLTYYHSANCSLGTWHLCAHYLPYHFAIAMTFNVLKMCMEWHFSHLFGCVIYSWNAWTWTLIIGKKMLRDINEHIAKNKWAHNSSIIITIMMKWEGKMLAPRTHTYSVLMNITTTVKTKQKSSPFWSE